MNGPRLATTVLVAVYLAASCFAGSVHAHPLAPSFLEIHETGADLQRDGDGTSLRVLWKISLQNSRAAALEPLLPPACRTLTAGWSDHPAIERRNGALIRRWRAECGAAGLEGRLIGIDGLELVDTAVLVRIVLADGRTVQSVLGADTPVFAVPRRSTPPQVAVGYLWLGFRHILGGLDHLLFVLGLLFMVDGWRRLLGTVTAFTLGHSVTLSLAALGFVRFPSALVELAIALSIWFVALELVRRVELRRQSPLGEGRPGRPPWRMAALFGLLHGLGFAGALAEVGLPKDEIFLALVSFNSGIEIGQLVFIAVVLGLVAAAGRFPRWAVLPRFVRQDSSPHRPERRLALPAAYLIGSLSFYWFLRRGADLL